MAFHGFLKQNTAVTVKIGPFVDSTDGDTDETALTISQADIRLSKNGGDMAQKDDAATCTHDEIGIYDCALSIADTDTLGRLSLIVHESGALHVRQDYIVLPANVFDSFVSGTDMLDVSLVQWLGIAPLALSSQRVQSHMGATDAGSITATSLAADAITAAKIAADAITEIQAGLSTFNPASNTVTINPAQTPSEVPTQGTFDDAIKRIVTALPLYSSVGEGPGLATAFNVYDLAVRASVATAAGPGDFTLTFDNYDGNDDEDNQFPGMYLVFRDGPNSKRGQVISTYTGTTKRVQFTDSRSDHADAPFPNTPVEGNQVLILGLR